MLQEHSEALQFEPVFERCDDYNALQRALRARASKLPLTRRDLDEASGLANGFCGGALAENFTRRLAAQNLYSLLGALGLALIVVDDFRGNRARLKDRKSLSATSRVAVSMGQYGGQDGQASQGSQRSKPAEVARN